MKFYFEENSIDENIWHQMVLALISQLSVWRLVNPSEMYWFLVNNCKAFETNKLRVRNETIIC
jgi:hypothetical protein